MGGPTQAQDQDPRGTYGHPCFSDGTCAGGACNARGSCSDRMIGGASWMFILPLNHDSASSDSRY